MTFYQIYGFIGGIFAFWYYYNYYLPKEYQKLNLPAYQVLPLGPKLLIMFLVVTVTVIFYPIIIIEIIIKHKKGVYNK